jgi:hypothetical protein
VAEEYTWYKRVDDSKCVIEAYIAWRVFRLSRAWAVVAVLDSAGAISWILFTRGWAANFTYFGLLILLWRIHAMRGTFAYKRFTEGARPTRVAPT